LPQLVVVIVEALPVGAELLKAGLVDILEPVIEESAEGILTRSNTPSSSRPSQNVSLNVATRYVHAPGAAGDSAALLQTLKLAPAGVLGLALHVVIVVVLAPGADEEGS
jgi:hypothetical protein